MQMRHIFSLPGNSVFLRLGVRRNDTQWITAVPQCGIGVHIVHMWSSTHQSENPFFTKLVRNVEGVVYCAYGVVHSLWKNRLNYIELKKYVYKIAAELHANGLNDDRTDRPRTSSLNEQTGSKWAWSIHSRKHSARGFLSLLKTTIDNKRNRRNVTALKAVFFTFHFRSFLRAYCEADFIQ